MVVASAGNFGQGVAYAGRAMGVPVTVFAATTANPLKVSAMRRLGADVRAVGEDFDAARVGAATFAADAGWHLLVDGEDPWISIGAGTIAAELTDAVEAGDLPALERVATECRALGARARRHAGHGRIRRCEGIVGGVARTDER